MSAEEHPKQAPKKQEGQTITADQEKLQEWAAERRDYDVITGAPPPQIPEPKTKQEKKASSEQ